MIIKKLIKYNYSKGNIPKYIVIHDTGNKSKGADAEAHYRYFNSADRQASAHYFADEKGIIQTVEDHNASWHCGDGHGKYGINNHNSLGIEICINEDGNYNKAVANALELTKQLMKKYNIPIHNVVRHYDASRKICPGTMSKNNWAKWDEFKKNLQENTLEDSLNILIDKGLINTPDYWLENAREGNMVKGEFAAILINRIAAFLVDFYQD